MSALFASSTAALDMARSSGHVDRLDDDFEQAAMRGLLIIREKIGGRLSEPGRGRYDLARLRRIAQTAKRHGLPVLWSVHCGTPPDVGLFDDALIGRFAAAAVSQLAPWPNSGFSRVSRQINEIGFLVWAVTTSGLIEPYAAQRACCESSETSGYRVKRRCAAYWPRSTPRARSIRMRFLHVEPAGNIVAPAGRPDLAASHFRTGRAPWLSEVAAELRAAHASAVARTGFWRYSRFDRPGWASSTAGCGTSMQRPATRRRAACAPRTLLCWPAGKGSTRTTRTCHDYRNRLLPFALGPRLSAASAPDVTAGQLLPHPVH